MTSLTRGIASLASPPDLFPSMRRFSASWRPLALAAAFILAQPLFANRANASTYSILHTFGDGTVVNDGNRVRTPLIQGSDGNFYGIASAGGSSGEGAIFKMTPAGAVTVLHSFGDGSVVNDGNTSTFGAFPDSCLIQGSDGNFYGTTIYGGSTAASDPNHTGSGTAFKMTPAGVVTILHSFGDGSVAGDGTVPAGIVQGADGNFYGTTLIGGSTPYGGTGTIFKMTALGAVTILHTFSDGSVAGDGMQPNAPLIRGSDGNFYGTTFFGGVTTNNVPNGYGTTFKVTPDGIVTILHRFGDGSVSSDGEWPTSSLVEASDGNFYGVTYAGGQFDGVAYKMTPAGVVSILHVFHGSIFGGGNDGEQPDASLIQGSDGSFYGTSGFGGIGGGNGTVFTMNSAGDVSILYTFGSGNAHDGNFPTTPVIEGSDGNFYGTTVFGGTSVAGTGNGGGIAYRLSTGLAPIPVAPVGFAATAGHAQATLSWLRSAGATSYNVYRGTSPGGESATPIATGITTTSFVNSGLTNGVTYYYKIVAMNANGSSLSSAESSAAPKAALSAPTNLTATGGAHQVSLSWTAVSGATSYNIYRGTTTGGENITPIATGVHTTSYTDQGLTGGVTYYYKVAASNGILSPLSNEASAKPSLPAAPTNLAATAGYAQVSLSWTAVAGVSSYNIYRGTTPGGENATPIASGIGTASYVDKTVTDGVTYYYTVASVSDSGTSVASNEVSATPLFASTPANLAAVAGYAQVSLSWTASTGAVSYNVYRGTTAGGESATPIASGVTTAGYVDKAVTDGVTYYYKIAAVNTGGTSSRSSEVSATPLFAATPANLVATPGYGQVTLSWSASAGAVSYNVYRGTTAGGESTTPIASGLTAASYADQTVTPGVTYYYTVSAVNTGGVSSPSAEVSAVPLLQVAPTNLTAMGGDQQITLTWTASPGASSYSVYRGAGPTLISPTPIATGITAGTYLDTGLRNTAVYYYQVVAVYPVGKSAPSNQAWTKPQPPVPGAPTGVQAIAGSAQVTLTWTATAGAVGYKIYRGTTPGGESATPVGSVTSNSYINTGLTHGVTYYYTVAAYNTSGIGSKSAEVSATP